MIISYLALPSLNKVFTYLLTIIIMIMIIRRVIVIMTMIIIMTMTMLMKIIMNDNEHFSLVRAPFKLALLNWIPLDKYGI